ncbi:MAG: transposase, partial [Pontiella sp.]
AHARRKFHEARNESPLAAQTLLEIQGLYRIEAELRDNPKQDRRTIRQQKSLPILRRIGLQLQSEQIAHRPKAKPENPSTTPSNSGTSCSSTPNTLR